MHRSPTPGREGARVLARLSPFLALPPIATATTTRSATPRRVTGRPGRAATSAGPLQRARACAPSRARITAGLPPPGISRAAACGLHGGVARTGSCVGTELALRLRTPPFRSRPGGAHRPPAKRRPAHWAGRKAPPRSHPAGPLAWPAARSRRGPHLTGGTCRR
jgi:hypothetical protein